MQKLLFISLVKLIRGKEDRKYSEQIKAWANLGFNVYYIAVDDVAAYLCHENERMFLLKLCKIRCIDNTIIFVKAVIKSLEIISDYSLCYCRYRPCLPSVLAMYSKIKNLGLKLIVEIPTWPYDGERSGDDFLHWVQWRIDVLLRNKLKKYVDLFAIIGHESNEVFGVHAVNIENGTWVDYYKEKERRTSIYNEEFHLIAVANLALWHGYDRVIEGLNNYYTNKNSKKQVYFHIIGEGQKNVVDYYKSLVQKYKLEKYVIFHGFKYGKELEDIFDICDIAVGSLGCHRKKLCFSSELKTKEYLSRGIPFIYATNEKALSQNTLFCYKISSDDNPVDIKEVMRFFDKIKEANNISTEMREFARNNYSWEMQFKKLLATQ